MRIISGKYRNRRFDVPKNFRARPTTDFAKENIFNVISNLLDFDGCVALDLFSGTGSISYELLSRGCKEVICVENDRFHYAFIKKIKEELKMDDLIPVQNDVFKYIKTVKQKFDFIFADPPYAMKDLARIPEIIISHNLLNDNALFVMEHSKEYDFSALPYFYQRRVYGAVNFSLFLFSHE